jgi:hypothetical protein
VQAEQEKIWGKRKGVRVNVPTRWAINHFVASDLVASEQALVLTVSTAEWGRLGKDTYAATFRANVLVQEFWSDMKCMLDPLRPFSDAIHQLEEDKPMLSQCHLVIEQLKDSVRSWLDKYHTKGVCKVSKGVCKVTYRAVETFERRIETDSDANLAPIYNAAYTAAYSFDPYYAVYDRDLKCMVMPEVEQELFDKAVVLVERVGGEKDGDELRQLMLHGYDKSSSKMIEFLLRKARGGGEAREPPASASRVKVWKRGVETYPALCDVACHLLLAHATSAASERNWSLWGQVFTGARRQPRMKNAKMLIAISANDRANNNVSKDFEVALSVVEDLAKDE